MKTKTSSSSSLCAAAALFLSLVLFLQNASFTAASVKETCKSVAEFVDLSFCLASLQADPSSKNADRAGLAVVAVNLSLVNATSTECKIQGLLKNATEASTKSGLEACSLLYYQGIGGLKPMVDLIKDKEFRAAKELSRVSVEVGSFCKQALPLEKGLLVKENGDFSQLTLLAEVILGPLATS